MLTPNTDLDLPRDSQGQMRALELASGTGEAEMLLGKTPSMEQRAESFARQPSRAIHHSPIPAEGSFQAGAFSGARGASSARNREKCGDSRSPGHPPLTGHEACG